MLAALTFSACTVKDSKSDTSLARDSALNRDLELANRDTAVQPQLQDVPATPAAGRRRPLPRRRAPRRRDPPDARRRPDARRSRRRPTPRTTPRRATR